MKVETEGDETDGEDSMNFYINTHPYYCGIDLQARLLYVCIIDDKGEVLVHIKIKDSPETNWRNYPAFFLNSASAGLTDEFLVPLLSIGNLNMQAAMRSHKRAR